MFIQHFSLKDWFKAFTDITSFNFRRSANSIKREEVPPGAWIGKLRHSRGMWLTICHSKTVTKFRLNFSLLPLAVSTPIIREGKYLNLQSSRCNFKCVHLPQLRSVFPEFSGICLLSPWYLWQTFEKLIHGKKESRFHFLLPSSPFHPFSSCYENFLANWGPKHFFSIP